MLENAEAFGLVEASASIIVDPALANPCEQDSRNSNNNHTGSGRIKNLWLYKNELAGTLPLELYWLTALRTMDFADNAKTGEKSKLTGSISSHIGLLTNLEALNLPLNSFTGTLPTELGLLSNTLSGGVLNSNSFEGTLPTELGQLAELDVLFLDFNQFYGALPTEVGQLSNLIWLVAMDNALTGPLPTELGKLSLLVGVALTSNYLTGQVPSELGTLSDLMFVLVDDNQLEGSIPSQIGLLSSLTLLSLGNNPLLTGTVPSQITQLLPPTNTVGFLAALNVANTSITGMIPPELCMVPGLNFTCSQTFCGCACACSAAGE